MLRCPKCFLSPHRWRPAALFDQRRMTIPGHGGGGEKSEGRSLTKKFVFIRTEQVGLLLFITNRKV